MLTKEGRIDWQAEYDPWGARLNYTKPDTIYQPIRLQGQHYDIESGLYYNRHRFYDPKIGRYISQDPIGLQGGSNLYAYPMNPNQEIDPMGLNPAVAIRIAVGIFSNGARTTEQAALPTVTVNGVSTVLLPGEDIFDAIRRQQIQDGYMLTETQCVRTDAEQKDADHKNYNNNCEREPPDGLSPCELAKWKYRKEKK